MYLLLFDQSLGVLHVLLQFHIVALECIVLLKVLINLRKKNKIKIKIKIEIKSDGTELRV